MSGEPEGVSLGKFADPHSPVAPIAIGDEPRDRLMAQLERMLLIRRAEEAIAELVTSREARCPCHLAIGQEACAVGVASAFRQGDRAFGAHRSHGHYLALGGDIDELFAEVLGRATGCSRGMGGSMHIVAPEQGLLGTVPIVAATIPIAVGSALAAKMEGNNALAVSFFGDGATEEGIFHESLNLASLDKLPIIFACENNLFSSHLRVDERQPADSVARYARAHLVACEVVDGNDVRAVTAASQRAALRARLGEGPTFLELVTYRWRGHVGPSEDIDVGVRRNQDLVHWKGRDPIARMQSAMIAAGTISPVEAEAADQAARHRVAEAVAKARAAPWPAEEALERYVFASRLND
jgi:pyruvate dehydrogenase E1 component alpha subunit